MQLVEMSVRLIKLFYLLGIEHGLLFRDAVNLTDKAEIQSLDYWVGCLGHKYCMHVSAGERVSSLGSSLRQNWKLMHVLLQGSPLCFSLADCCNRWLSCAQLSPSTVFLCWSADHVFDVRTPGTGAWCVCILALHTTCTLQLCVCQWFVWMHLTVFISLFIIATDYSLHQNEDEQSVDLTVNYFLVIRELRKHRFS